MAARLRVQLGFSPPGDAPVRFWWQPPQGAGTIAELLQRLGADLGLEPSQRSRLAATMDGFVVLGGSRTDLLRDGDTLLVSLGSKRGLASDEPADSEGVAVQPPAAKRHKPQVLPAAAPESSSSEEESSSEEKSSSSAEESSSSESERSGRQQDMQTPTPTAPVANNATTGKRPSRSARRKAAKRRLRRLGVLPAGKGAAAAALALAAAPAVVTAAKQQPKSAARAERPTQAAPQQPAPAVQAQAPTGQQQQQAEGQQQPQKQLPEVVVPAEWQLGPGKRHGQQHKQRGGKQQPTHQPPQHGSFHAVPPPAAAAATSAGQAATPAPQPALDEAAFGQLPPLEGEPCVGDVLAYRLLEIGAGLQPSVSEARCGRVTEVAPPAITLAPHPDAAVHPLSYQRALRRALRLQAAAAAGDEEAEAEEDSDDEVFGSQYDEEGLLTAELASFVELRMLQPASGQRNKQTTPAQPAPAAAAAATTVQKAAVAAPEPAARLTAAPVTTTNGGSTAGEGLGPSSYSQLGPPRPASRGDVIAAEGGWASLYEQLRQRRAQLVGQSGEAAQQQGAATADAGTPKALPQQPNGSAAKAVRSAPPAAGREHINSNRATATSGGRGPGSLTPGATRPRAGVRRTALGPMLRMLRASSELS